MEVTVITPHGAGEFHPQDWFHAKEIQIRENPIAFPRRTSETPKLLGLGTCHIWQFFNRREFS